MSKRKDLQRMYNFVGNYAAHFALYGSEREREATVYLEQAEDIAMSRSWNQYDIAEFKLHAMRRAESEIKRRLPEIRVDIREKNQYLKKAEDYIDGFITKNMAKAKRTPKINADGGQ